jgi:cytochrome c-type biogenesis protein CcmH/NrfF
VKPKAAALAAAIALSALSALSALGGGVANAAVPRASLSDIENDVMCVSCHEPLALAQSPQAYAERNFVRSLIGQGQTKAQIEQALVAQYGPAVLGRPPAHGFNLTVYVLPPALVLVGIATLALTLPKWRRRTRAATASPPSTPPLDPGDAHRLDEDLARHP